MKAMDQPCNAVHRKDSARPSGTGFKVCKASRNDAQIQALFAKLRELVPDAGERKMNKTQLLQSVIDYILDLTDALDSSEPVACAGGGAAVVAAGATKQPLTERTDLNRMDAQVDDSDEEDDAALAV